MAVLTDADRKNIWANYMRKLSNRQDSISIIKSELRDAINAVDSWIDSNQTSYNNSLPLPAKTNLTQKQKAELMVFVIQRRWEVI